MKVGYDYYVKLVRSIHDHFNLVHVGVEILSTSKRIMNEVMCCAEDNNLNIFYQDTDSMHIVQDQVPILAERFQEDYDRELIGEDLGQFHIDFEMEGAKKNADIYSVESYFLGKKTYYDKLESINDENKVIHSEHIRNKGVPNTAMYGYAEAHNISVKDLYKHHYDGGEIEYDLTLKKGIKTKKTKDMGIETMKQGDKGTTRRVKIRDADQKRVPTIYV